MENLNTYVKSGIIGLSVLLGSSFSSVGQDSLIYQSTKNYSALTFAEQAKYSKIVSKETYSEHYIVELESIEEKQNEGKIKINIPDHDCQDLIYAARSVEYNNTNDYYWYGVFKSDSEESCVCRSGMIILISTEYGKIGYITIDEDSYELAELSSSTYLLSKVDDTQFDQEECWIDSVATFKKNPPDSRVHDRTEESCIVKCLVLFTENAEDEEGGVSTLTNKAILAVAQTNQALQNSDIGAADIRVELVGVVPIDLEETNWIERDIVNLAEDDDVHALRNSYEADIVVLFTYGDYLNSLGWVFDIGPNNEKAYAIVEVNYATSRFVFAHEVGHLFGCRHENDPTPGIAHGHAFREVPCIAYPKYKTLLHTMHGIGSRILHYSNPDVLYRNLETGIENSRDNAGKIKEQGCNVANFRDSEQPFYIHINGDRYMCPCMPALIQATILGGVPGTSYTYDWFVSSDGINWTPLIYAGANAAINVPCTEGEGKFVKVEVEGSDGNSGIARAFIEAATSWPGQTGSCNLLRVQNSPENIEIKTIPNPSFAEQVVQVEVQNGGYYSIYLKDINGKIIQSILRNEFLSKGTYNFKFNNDYKGFFIINCQDDKGNLAAGKVIRF